MSEKWQKVARTAREALDELSQAERRVNDEIRALEDRALQEGRALDAAERRRWDELNDARNDVLNRRKQVAIAAVRALEASPDTVALRRRFRVIGQRLEETKRRVEGIAQAADRIARAIALIENVLTRIAAL